MAEFRRPADIAYESADEGPQDAGRRERWPRWGLLIAIVGIVIGVVALLVPAGLWVAERVSDARSREGTLAISETFRREAPGEWTLVIIVENAGPGTPPRVNLQMTTVQALCFEGTIVEDKTGAADLEDLEVTGRGAACDGGSELLSGGSLSQDQIPIASIRAVADDQQGLDPDTGTYSASASDLRPNEVLWFEFSFAVHPTLDEDLRDASADPQELIQSIALLLVTGEGVTTNDPIYDISTLPAPG